MPFTSDEIDLIECILRNQNHVKAQLKVNLSNLRSILMMFKFDNKRKSGDWNTSIGNSLVNSKAYFEILKHYQGEKPTSHLFSDCFV